jgi:phosphopantothenoylcysteine decarboxylase/phosphopantothenate--cysteine ligase
MENPDITKELSTSKHGQVMVGFAAQTEPTIDEALNVAGVKLREKGLDFIYCNDVSEGRIFGSEITSGTVLDATGLLMTFSGAQKITLANYLLDLALSKLG